MLSTVELNRHYTAWEMRFISLSMWFSSRMDILRAQVEKWQTPPDSVRSAITVDLRQPELEKTIMAIHNCLEQMRVFSAPRRTSELLQYDAAYEYMDEELRNLVRQHGEKLKRYI